MKCARLPLFRTSSFICDVPLHHFLPPPSQNHSPLLVHLGFQNKIRTIPSLLLNHHIHHPYNNQSWRLFPLLHHSLFSLQKLLSAVLCLYCRSVALPRPIFHCPFPIVQLGNQGRGWLPSFLPSLLLSFTIPPSSNSRLRFTTSLSISNLECAFQGHVEAQKVP